MLNLKSDGVQSEVPHISDGVVQSVLDAPQVGGVLLQELAVVLQLNLGVYFCGVKGFIKQSLCCRSRLRPLLRLDSSSSSL